MCGYFCIGFIHFILEGNSVLEYTNLLSPSKYKENDKIVWKKILTFFKRRVSIIL